jgi:hypothetical protein
MASDYYQYQQWINGVVAKFSLQIRKQMFERLMAEIKPDGAFRVLDVGVTTDQRADSNFFEKWYPYTRQITAVGTEDARFLEDCHPGLKFIRTDGERLPFADKEFDLVTSFATLEHVGGFTRQRFFLEELCRVGKVACFSTPNRWYPLEFHTVTPFLHWLPRPWFRSLMKLTGRGFYAAEENLNLLSSRDVIRLLPAGHDCKSYHFRLFGPVSNLLFFVR